jgi:hypothetical protein
MSILQIPINLGPNRSIDEVGLHGYNAFLYDGFVDAAGSVNRRAGLVEFSDLSTSACVDGLYWWDRQSKVIAVCDGDIYSIAQNGDVTALGGDTLESGYPVYFADFNTTLYAANGGQIVGIPASGTPAYLTDGDAPTTVRAIAELDTYLLALEDATERVWYSQPGDPTDWQGLFVSAQYKPDLAKVIGVRNDVIEIVGTQSIEGWRDDGSTPFVKESQYTIDHGVLAPHSFKFCTGFDGNGYWYWLNEHRQIVRMVGRQAVPVSPESLGKYLQTFSSVSDAIGGECDINGTPHYVITFPTEDKTIAINLGIGAWSEFGYWDSGSASHERWRGSSYAFATAWNLQLVGDYENGKIYKTDSTTYQDDGSTLNTLIRTENVDRGTLSERKYPRALYIWVKKSNVSTITDAATLTIKWKDSGRTAWKTERSVALGYVGDTVFRGKVTDLGSYYSRQYQISMTDNAPLVLVRIEEEF